MIALQERIKNKRFVKGLDVEVIL
jgi:hypothetical protein